MLNPAEVGTRIKRVRDQKGMTLRDVARRAGVSPTLISDIERGKTSPTIKSLAKISSALDETIVTFIQESPATSVTHTDRDNQVSMISSRGDIEMTTLSGGISGSRIDVVRVSYGPRYERKRPLVHEGEKCAYVLKGAIEVEIDDKRYTVRAGETIHFDGRLPHRVRNPRRSVAEVIWVATPKLATLQL